MSEVICYENQGGTISVVIPAPEFLATRKYPDSADNFETYTLQDIAEKDVPAGFDYVIVDKANLPQDRIFRNAWVLNGEEVGIDLPKAKDIRMEQLRVMREPIMESLDVEFMKALESGNTELQQSITAQKQALRDFTSDPLPDDIEALKTYIPDVLK
jgi:hypothetical protein